LVQCKNNRAHCECALIQSSRHRICAVTELCAASLSASAPKTFFSTTHHAHRMQMSIEVHKRKQRSECVARVWLRALDQSLIVSVSISASTRSCEGDVVRHAPAPWATASLRIEALTGSESPKRKFDVAPTGCSTPLPGRPGRPTIRPVSASRYCPTGVGVDTLQKTQRRQVRHQAIMVGRFGPLR